jgi:hypothetical protein
MFTTEPLCAVRPVAAYSLCASSALAFAADATNATPAIMSDVLPYPFESSTLTAITFAAFATPYLREAIIPAQCVLPPG